MSKKSFIDSVKVGVPCSEDWEMMTGTDKIRFCSHCAKEINNISEMTRKEAARLVRAAGPDLCIRYIPDRSSRPMFAEQLYKITRRGSGLTAGVMTASLSLATFTFAQNDKPSDNAPQAVIVSSETSESTTTAERNDAALGLTTGTIEGVIRDLAGKPVPGVAVELYSAEYSHNDSLETRTDGSFSFSKLEPGQYGLRVLDATGLRKKAASGLTVIAGQTIFRDINVSTLPVALADGTGTGYGTGSGMGGAMVSMPYSRPLTAAAADDDVKKVRELIAAGVKVNAKDKNYDNITPLFVAVENGNVEIIRMLLNAGAKVNAVNDQKRTPLMYIDSDATPELIEILVRAGANINARDDDGGSALGSAVISCPPQVIQALINAGADIEQTDNEGVTPLIKAADGDDAEAVKILVMAGASINARDRSGESAWDKTSNPEIEAFLEDYGAAVSRDLIEVTAVTAPTPK
jgi:Ankyrin repeats (3 copies)/Carboxypeptidase regulatory-like domain/Ankyrin repeats (many copies)